MDHSQGFLKIVDAARTGVREVTVHYVNASLGNGASLVLVDVREDREWALGHVTGAEHIGKGIIERDIEARIPEKATEVVLYCGGGYRSVLAAAALAAMGYTNVASMAGGWRAWNEAGYPVDL
ncbi:MAG: rhodanese-like domain-containing protein [Gemmatimonadaceae bacterium]|nr:rhodanese-like domain-containing protein [Gemmatimonadaceae bacterium]